MYVAATTRGLTEDFEDTRMSAAISSVQAYLDANLRQTRASAIAMGSSAELIRLINHGTQKEVWQYLVKAKAALCVN